MIIDFHTHAFPDNVAAKAIPALEKEGDIKAKTSGTARSLLASMDRAGIDRSIICSIATRPEQFNSILDWSGQIRCERLIPLPSIHPDDPDCVEKVYTVHKQGFIGIKMHPYYQNYFLSEKRLTPFYEALSETGLLLVVHCGYDIAYTHIRCADPAQILTLHQNFPRLRLITTHFGGWQLWDEVEEMLIGRKIYMEISFALQYLQEEQAVRMLTSHPPEYLLFGSDSPWDDQAECIARLQALKLEPKLVAAIFGENARKLIDS
ncbi:MAG: amidohydrolase family protein [Proteobacteria bacterium]|nr:amidohydrolase family protein [Pseudomonadota bacterium]